MAILQVSVKGKLGQISALSFAAILQRSIQVLQDLDRRISEERRGTVDWVINDVRKGSVVLEIASRPRRGIKEEYSSRAVRGFTTGLQTIHDSGETPRYFSQDNLSAVREIVRQFGRDGVEGVEFLPPNEKPVELTPETEPQLEKLVGVRYRTLGSIEGMIELVSVRHGSRRFNITQERTLRVIRCSFPESIEASVIEALRDRRRVVAMGIIAYNGKDEAFSLDIRHPLRFLGRPDELPRSSDLAGSDPDITGPLTTEDYIRSIRSG